MESVAKTVSKPSCSLIGEDGNALNIICLVRNALNKSGRQAQAREFMSKAFASHSHGEVLMLARQYVNIV